MIYNEVLIISKCGLNTNTKIQLDNKFYEENNTINITSNCDENVENPGIEMPMITTDEVY